MIVLNLVNIKESDIEYKISQFPDGQQDIVINIDFIHSFSKKTLKEGIIIKSRFNSWKDLELIICANKALKRLGYKKLHLYIPYLLGSRSDREFQRGGNSYLVDVIAPVLNNLKFKSILTLDVHSDVAVACIKNLKVQDNYSLVNQAFININNKNLTIISPDAGSLKKIYPLVKLLNYKKDIIVASKHRDLVTGNILSTEVPLIKYNEDYIIIDDICDGGRTFIEIAKVIKQFHLNSGFTPKIYLVVTHGIFSAGFVELGKYFDTIYCSNSIQDIGQLYGNDNKETKVKQFKTI